ncbi:MAG: hypothetical protein KKD48_03320 [Nanoarchaeota archaeon]|nr:hypothetical protein [Nanoarchaeota archaeon]
MKNYIKNLLAVGIFSYLTLLGLGKPVTEEVKTETVSEYKCGNFDQEWKYITKEFIPNINKSQMDGKQVYLEDIFNNITKENCEKFNWLDDMQNYFEEHGKVLVIGTALNDNTKFTISAGTLVKEPLKEIYKDYGHNLEYKIILYKSENESYDALAVNKRPTISFWEETTKTAYIDVDVIDEWANKIKNLDISEHNLKKARKIKRILEKKARKNNTTFEDEFLNMIIETTGKHHEPGHHYYPSDENKVDKMEFENSPKEYKLWLMMYYN